MSDAISESLQAVATEGNVAAGSEMTGQAIDLVLKLVNDFIVLISTNWWWAVAIIVLMKAEDMVIEHFGLPLPKGNVRWILLFLFTMFTSFLWKSFVEGLLPSA